MRENYIKKMVFSAIFITLVFVSTYIIRIPSPINGYVNLGDGFVLASGWLLGPVFGPISAGIGSMFTDLL
ncbi:MAG: ECF transporter S component, partial [Clostridia bacterium]|nr:ECF transporter S component [Clostridia bacterium]